MAANTHHFVRDPSGSGFPVGIPTAPGQPLLRGPANLRRRRRGSSTEPIQRQAPLVDPVQAFGPDPVASRTRGAAQRVAVPPAIGRAPVDFMDVDNERDEGFIGHELRDDPSVSPEPMPTPFVLPRTCDLTYQQHLVHSPTEAFQFHLVQDLSDADLRAAAYPKSTRQTKWAGVAIFRCKFGNQSQLLSCCSLCPTSHTALRDFMGHNSYVFDDDAQESLAGCNHAKVALALTAARLGLSSHHQSFPAFYTSLDARISDDIPTVPPGSLGWFRKSQQGGGVEGYLTQDLALQIMVNYNGARFCGACPWSASNRPCKHVQFHMFPPQAAWPVAQTSTRSETAPTPDRKYLRSKQHYPFLFDEQALQRLLSRRSGCFLPWMRATFGKEESKPVIPLDTALCPACGNSIHVQNGEVVVFARDTFALGWSLEVGQCSAAGCGQSVSFDGRKFGLINWGNRYLFACELLSSYFDLYSRNGLPLNAWWQNKVSDMQPQLLSLSSLSETDKSRLITKWTNFACKLPAVLSGFVSLIDFPVDAFKCCESPRVVSADGIVLSPEAHRLNPLSHPWVNGEIRSRATTIADRSLPALSQLENDFVDSFLSNSPTVDPNLAAQVLQSESRAPALLAYLCTSASHAQLAQVRSNCRLFAQSLLKSVSPACQLLPYPAITFFASFLAPRNRVGEAAAQHDSGVTSSFRKRLSLHCPILALVFAACMLVGGDAINHFRRLLVQLRDIVTSVFAPPTDPVLRTVFGAPSPEMVAASPITQLFECGSYFPNHPIVRTVKHVLLRNERKRGECTKNAKGKDKLGPGVLLFYCAEHWTCIGFEVLLEAESVSVVFQALSTRFQEPPAYFIYDNACNLSEYILNRAPSLFKNTTFLVDGFHFNSHTNCSAAFDSFQHLSGLDGAKSTVQEQRNQHLDKLKLTAPHMRFDTLAAYLLYTIALLNSRPSK
ncbi:hypothetical protein BCR44DRAFT_78206 [Catenaria anguillulae PL171]|uniref:HMG domain-containing protein n=1 Tax=Catenaria anguillulae PL171 TaxID=765915 RepID=A0A1Y2H7S1_9FUNG|nr:hypothetical protein BCR44DRAFT_78206 [Catenaria anguillulae PL171]